MKQGFTSSGNIIYENSGIQCLRRSMSQILWQDNFMANSKFWRCASIDNSIRLIRFYTSLHKHAVSGTNKEFCVHFQNLCSHSEVFTSKVSEMLWPLREENYKSWGLICNPFSPSWQHDLPILLKLGYTVEEGSHRPEMQYSGYCIL